MGVPTAKVSKDDRPPPTGKGSSTTSANSTKLENSFDPILATQSISVNTITKSMFMQHFGVKDKR